MDAPYQWTKQVASHWGGTRNGTDRPLAQRDQGAGRDPQPVPPRHRRRPDGPRGRRSARADLRQRRPAGAVRGRQHALHVRRRRRAPTGTRRSTSRCSSTAASTTRAGRRSPATARRGSSPRCRRSTTTSGSSTRPTTGPRRTTWPPSSPSGSHELQRLFLIEAVKHNVLPLDDRRVERFNSDLAGRPQLVQRQAPDAVRRDGPAVRELGPRASRTSRYAVTAQVDVPDGGRRRRDRRPGRRLRRLEPLRASTASRPTATTCSGCGGSRSTATAAIPAGEHQVRMEFAYDGGGLGKGGTATLFVDGARSARAGSTRPCRWSSRRDETTDLGQRHRHPGDATTSAATGSRSTAASRGSSSTSAMPPRTTTTSSRPRSGSASRWPASRFWRLRADRFVSRPAAAADQPFVKLTRNSSVPVSAIETMNPPMFGDVIE